MQKFEYRINTPKVAHQTIDQETIIIDFESGAYYSINGVGSLVWESVAKGMSVKQIIDLITQRYSGQREIIEQEVKDFLEELRNETLLVTKKDSTSTYLSSENGPIYTSVERLSYTSPSFQKYTDMQDLLLLDPIHEVDDEGWPVPTKDDNQT